MAKTIGRYEIRKEIGRGGMAAVYLAYDPRLDRTVALKILDQQLSADPAFSARFEREAKTVAALEHSAIVSLYDYGEADGWLFLVMRYMKGGTLKEKIAQGPLSTRQAYAVVRRISSALDRAHDHGIIHRDLKPANILLDEEGAAFLSDFGIVKMAKGDGEYLTETGQTIGTYAYMSPEQVQGKALDGRSDIYALGIVLYEMLAGSHPFGDVTTSGGMAIAHAHQEVPDVTLENPELSPAMNQIIQKAMAKEPADRYGTPREMALALYRALTGKPATAAAVAAAAATTEPEPAAASRTSTIPEAAADQPATGYEAAAVRAPAEQAPAGQIPAGPKKSKAPVWLFVIAGVVAVACIGIAGLAFLGSLGGGSGADNKNDSTAVVDEELPPDEQEGSDDVVQQVTGDETLTCTDAIGCVEIGPDEPILLATALVNSGPNAALGLESEAAVQVALKFHGALFGHEVEVLNLGTNCEAESGKEAATIVVAEPQMLAMIGTTCSSSAVTALPIISEAGYAMVSPSNGEPGMTDPGQYWQPGYLRTSINHINQAQAMAQFAFQQLGLRRAAAIHDEDTYTITMAEAFATTFAEMGGEIVAFDGITADQTDFTDLMASTAAAGPEIIYLPLYAEKAAAVVNAAQTKGLAGVALAAADDVMMTEFPVMAGGAAEGMFVSQPNFNFDSSFYHEHYVPAFVQLYGAEATWPYHALAFDATKLILTAIEKAAQRADDGTLLIGRQALRDALYATRDLEGVSGVLNCGEFGDCAEPLINIYQVQNGEFWQVSD